MEADLHPHRSRYYLNPKIDDPEQHEAQVAALCDVYAQAPRLANEGVHVVSTDEKTGIQALERAAPTRPTRPGLDERVEFEYIRHGTACLTANLDVVSGKIIAPTLGSTRNEEDFAIHVKQTVATDPSASWVFVVDNLSTHSTESLVRLVAEAEGLDGDLGAKRKRGILRDTKTRRAFLTDALRKKIRFVFTPKHCSWLNQVEIWFSILARRALKRASFSSVEHLKRAMTDFIEYFNRVLAKPFRWTYRGKVLSA